MKKLNSKKTRLIRTGAICVIALLIGGSSAGGFGEKSIKEVIDQVIQLVDVQQDVEYGVAEVVRIVDGDTIIALIDGQEQKIRLIGIDTPESAGQYKNNPQPGGKEAADFMNELVPIGSNVYLSSDAGDADRYGRLLRYVWLEVPDDDRVKETMVNCILLDKGYAALMTVPPNVKYVDIFKDLVHSGENSGK